MDKQQMIATEDEVQGYAMSHAARVIGQASCWAFAGLGTAAAAVATAPAGGVGGVVAAPLFAGAASVCSAQYDSSR